MNTGIYTITNNANGKYYVGSAKNFRSRWQDHRKTLRAGSHDNQILQRSWNKYGESAFAFAPVLFCAPENLILYEQICMDALRPQYNILKVAGSSLGYKHTPEVRAALSAQKCGKAQGPHSTETRANIAAALSGKRKSTTHIANFVASRVGTTATAETRYRMSVAHRGRTHTPAAIEKMRVAALARPPRSAEYLANMSRAHLGKKNGPLSAAHKEKISAAHRGIKHSPAQIAAVRAGLLRYNEAKRKVVQNEAITLEAT